jgi:bifunctional DNase/RNase
MTTIPVKLARILRQEKSSHSIVVLLNEQHQMVLPLLFTNIGARLSDIRTCAFSSDEALSSEPLTGDFIVHILAALGGAIEEISIDALPDDLLYALVQLHTSNGAHTLKARLEDALFLALRLHCTLTVAEDVFNTMGVSLIGKGETQEQQIDTVVAMMRWLPLRTTSQPPDTFNSILTSSTPRNLDFSQALRGWMIFGYPINPKSYELHFDSNSTYSGKSSLVLTLASAELSTPEKFIGDRMISLVHEGFLATSYRGQRLRITTYVKAENVKRANFHLTIVGPTLEPDSVRIVQHMTSTQQHPVEGTSDWTQHDLVIDVPTNANSIQLSFSMEGHGTVWLDNIHVAVVDKSIPLTGTRIIPPPREPQNLDFAHGLEYWHLTGTFPQDYTSVVDATTYPDKAHIISIASIKPEPRGNIILQQTLSPHDYHGKRVRFSATIQSISIEQQAGLYISAGIGINEERMKRTLHGTTKWTPYEVVLDVVNPNSYINFGLMLRGRGQVRITNAHFEVLGPIS